MFVLIGAYGQNGGFGDYCSPDFVDEGGFATTENGEVVVFETKEEAEKVAEQMTVMCENIFWDVPIHGVCKIFLKMMLVNS